MDVSEDGYTIFSRFVDGYGWVMGFSSSELESLIGNKELDMTEEKSEVPLRPVAIFYDPPSTSVFWNDRTSTKVSTHEEPFVKEHGYAMALARKIYEGNRSEFLCDVELGYTHISDMQ